MVDAKEKVIGKAAFLDDLEFPGMLYGKILRSPFAHARIVHIDTSRAERLPGVSLHHRQGHSDRKIRLSFL